jgi:hypothetical protein
MTLRAQRLPRIVAVQFIAFILLGLIVVVGAGCGGTDAGVVPPSSTATSTATLPTPFDCASMTPGPGTLDTFPLPPHTVSTFTSGAAGAGFWIECTPSATQASITSFLSSALPQVGWRPWDPQTDNAQGCGTEPNDFWKWAKGDSAVGYLFVMNWLPRWNLVFCSLSYGH